MKNGLAIVFALSSLLLQGCQNLGHNVSYLLQDKKELRDFYALEEINCREVVDRFPPFVSQQKYDREGIFAKCAWEDYDKERARHGPREVPGPPTDMPQELKQDREKHLAKIYSSNLRFSATDHYDIRTVRRPIRAGDPLNIIINKIHLKWNGELLSKISDNFDSLDTGEIAVVVTVDDGKAEEPRHVMVAYETGIPNDVDLPIGDLLAYSTDSYADEPIRIEVTVLDLDEKENRATIDILNTAAEAGKFFQPAFTPAYSIAAKVGELLLQAHKDDIITKMTFQLYPWKTGDPGRVSGHIGVPKVGEGRYLIVNSPSQKEMNEKDSSLVQYRNTIHANFDLKAYSVDISKNEFEDLAKTVEEKHTDGTVPGIRPWPIPLTEEAKFPRLPLDLNYVVLTVDSSPLSSAGRIIARLDTVNRAAAGMMQRSLLTPETAKGLNTALDDVKGLIERTALIEQFHDTKTDPEALVNLFDAYYKEDKKYTDLTQKDKGSILLLIRTMLPCMSEWFINSQEPSKVQSIQTLETWYKRVKGRLIYDQTTGRYDYMQPLRDDREESCYLSPS